MSNLFESDRQNKLTFDVTAVINLHREGQMCFASIRSLLLTAQRARAAGLSVECLAVLDNADDETASIAASFKADGLEIINTSVKDLGLARNAAIEKARGRFVSFLDGDDLWDEMWLHRSVEQLVAMGTVDAVAHPELVFCFGGSNEIFVHTDTRNRDCNLEAMRVTNLWTALSTAHISVFRRYPYERNEISQGWGYEDWNWNARTISNGVAHIAVRGGFHFVRKGHFSLSRQSIGAGVRVKPTELSKYAFWDARETDRDIEKHPSPDPLKARAS